MKVIKPNAIDITTDGSFSRSTTGTYIDSDGVMKTAAINVPRFDYDLSALTFKGLLLERLVTNQCLYSQEMLTGWTRGSGATTWASNQGVAPNGTTTALGVNGLYGFGLTTVEGTLYRTITGLSIGSEYTFSVYVKPAGAIDEVISLRFISSVSVDRLESFTIPASKWTRLSLSVVVDATTAQIAIGTPSISDKADVFIWGAQVELGYRPTSYIATTSTTVTRAADTVTGSNLIYSTVTDATAAYSSGTTYALGAKVKYLNQIWESLQASNLNKQPNLNPTWWYLIGPDNLHAPFDLSVSTKSTMPTIQTMVIKPGAFDSIALIEVDAEVIEVSATDYTGKEIYYSGTFGLSGSIVYDWYQYFFESLTEERTQILVQGLLAVYPEAVITVRLRSAIGANNSIGALIAGITTEIGGSQYGISAGITDYSRKDTDEFGNITFIQRNYSKRLSADVHFPNTEINKVQRFLYSIRAQPVVWVGSDDPTYEEPLVVFGFYRDFSTTIAYPTHSLCSIEVEGLT